MKKEPDYRNDLPLRIVTCIAMGGILMLAFICLFVQFGFHSVVGREAVYLSALFLIGNILMLRHRERRWAKHFPPLSPAMQRVQRVVGCGWLLGVLLLLASAVLLLFGLSLGAFWNRLTVISGYVLMLLGWGGRLMVYHRRCTAASVMAARRSEQAASL